MMMAELEAVDAGEVSSQCVDLELVHADLMAVPQNRRQTSG